MSSQESSISNSQERSPYDLSTVTVREVFPFSSSSAHDLSDADTVSAGERGGPISSRVFILPARPYAERSTRISQRIQEFLKPRNILLSAEYPHGLNYHEFKAFERLIANSIEWLEQKMAMSENSGVLEYMREHTVIEGLKMESEQVMKEAELFFHRGLVRSLLSSKQQETLLSARLFHLRATAALVVALIHLENAVTTTNDDDDDNPDNDDRTISDTSCGSSIRSTVSSFDGSRSFHTVNSIRVANLQLEINHLRATIEQHAEEIQRLCEQLPRRAEENSSTSVGYSASVASQDSLRTYATAFASHEYQLPPSIIQNPMSNLPLIQSCKVETSVITFTTAREEVHGDPRQNCRGSLSALRGSLSRISVCTANASVLTFATARDYQEPLDLLAQSMLEHGTVPDTIAPVDHNSTSPFQTPLPQFPPVSSTPKPVSIAILNSSQQWICVKARLDPRLYIRSRQTSRRTGGSGVFSGLIYGELLQTLRLPKHPFVTPFPILYGGRQLFGIGKVRIEYRITAEPSQSEQEPQGGQVEDSAIEEADFLKWRLDCIVCRERPSSGWVKDRDGGDDVEEWDVVLGKGAMWV